MKAARFNQELDLQRKEALFLRYGSETPCIDPKPKPLLTIAFVAKLMKLSIGRISHLEKGYF
jgi:hypothetical protein